MGVGGQRWSIGFDGKRKTVEPRVTVQVSKVSIIWGLRKLGLHDRESKSQRNWEIKWSEEGLWSTYATVGQSEKGEFRHWVKKKIWGSRSIRGDVGQPAQNTVGQKRVNIVDWKAETLVNSRNSRLVKKRLCHQHCWKNNHVGRMLDRKRKGKETTVFFQFTLRAAKVKIWGRRLLDSSI